MKQHVRRSKTPVKLFQNIVTKESETKSKGKHPTEEQYHKKADQNMELMENKNILKVKNDAELDNESGNTLQNKDPHENREVTKELIVLDGPASLSVIDETKNNTQYPDTPVSTKTRLDTNAHTQKERVVTTNEKESSQSVVNSTDNKCPVNHTNATEIYVEELTTNTTDIIDETHVPHADTEESAEAISASTTNDSTATLDQIEYDSISVHSELFYPDNWIYDSCSALDEVWKIGAEAMAGKRKREYKHYIYTDDDSGQKKELSPFKKHKTDMKHAHALGKLYV